MKCDIFLMILNSKKNTKGKSRKWNLPSSFKSLFFYILVFAPHALKGQKLLAQGIALGNYGRKPVAL